jgi:hypothetical protein
MEASPPDEERELVSAARRLAANRGSTLIGLVAAVAVLGAIAGVAFAVNGSGSTSKHAGAPLVVRGTTLSPSPADAGTDISAAAAEVCRADYQAVSQTVDAYRALNGQQPTSMSQLAPFLKDSVTSPYFTIGLDSAGVTVGVPGRPAAPGDGQCAYA